MLDDTRQSIAEAKTVGQINIDACFAEFVAEIAVAVQNIAKQRFGRGHIDIAVFIGTARDEPTPVRHIFFQHFKLFGVVFLHQFIAATALKAEHIVGVFLEQFKVVIQRGGNVFLDRPFKGPIPNGIKMRRRHGINRRFFLLFHRLPSALSFFPTFTKPKSPRGEDSRAAEHAERNRQKAVSVFIIAVIGFVKICDF